MEFRHPFSSPEPCLEIHYKIQLAGGTLLLELNRVLRPGGYFVWSATPVYRKREEDVGIWEGSSVSSTGRCFYLWNVSIRVIVCVSNIDSWFCTMTAAMSSLTKSMCWDLVSKKYDKVNKVGVAIYRKPSSNDCYQERMEAVPPLCEENDDPDAAWYINCS